MSAKNILELERLLNHLADGILSESDEVQLAEMLRTDAAARRQYRQFMALHADLFWDYAAAAISASGTPTSTGAQARDRRRHTSSRLPLAHDPIFPRTLLPTPPRSGESRGGEACGQWRR